MNANKKAYAEISLKIFVDLRVGIEETVEI